MKNSSKRQNAVRPHREQERRAGGIFGSLPFNVLFVIGACFVCALILSPLSEWLKEMAYSMSVDVELKGSFSHIMCDVGAQVLFYLSSFTVTAASFAGAAYISGFLSDGQMSAAVASAGILVLGMSASNLVQLGVYAIVRMRTPYAYLADTEGMLLDEAVAVGSALLVFVAALLLSRAGAGSAMYAGVCALGVFLISTGAELYDNIPFFVKGIILREDVISMMISLLLYMLHAVLGFFVMLLILNKRKATE